MSENILPLLLGILILGGVAAVLLSFFRSQPDLTLVVLGVAGWGAAVLFAVFPLLNSMTIEATGAKVGTSTSKVEVQAVNQAAVGAACGFAIGGGLCFIGAALARRDRAGTNV